MLAISDVMLSFEFKLMAYLDIASKIAKHQAKPEVECEDGVEIKTEGVEEFKHEVQEDFLKMI